MARERPGFPRHAGQRRVPPRHHRPRRSAGGRAAGVRLHARLGRESSGRRARLRGPHSVPEGWPRDDALFTIVTEGVESAVTQARTVAGDKTVSVKPARHVTPRRDSASGPKSFLAAGRGGVTRIRRSHPAKHARHRHPYTPHTFEFACKTRATPNPNREDPASLPMCIAGVVGRSGRAAVRSCRTLPAASVVGVRAAEHFMMAERGVWVHRR